MGTIAQSKEEGWVPDAFSPMLKQNGFDYRKIRTKDAQANYSFCVYQDSIIAANRSLFDELLGTASVDDLIGKIDIHTTIWKLVIESQNVHPELMDDEAIKNTTTRDSEFEVMKQDTKIRLPRKLSQFAI